jgi:hypothetical protein
MPVPESSYSRRYGREDSAFSSTSSYSRSASSALGGGRSYSSYSKLSSSTLPPRPPAYEYRKYSTTTTDTPSRFLSSSASRVGGGYRSSVSPVRATASSIRRQLEASAPSIAEPPGHVIVKNLAAVMSLPPTQLESGVRAATFPPLRVASSRQEVGAGPRHPVEEEE